MRKLSEKNEKEFAELKELVDFYAIHVLKSDPNSPNHPTKVAEYISAEFGRGKALNGLRQAANDALSHFQEMNKEDQEKISGMLQNEKGISLNKLRKDYQRKYQTILKRGIINNETEYYLISGILNDSFSDLTENEIQVLGDLVYEYEKRLTKSLHSDG